VHAVAGGQEELRRRLRAPCWGATERGAAPATSMPPDAVGRRPIIRQRLGLGWAARWGAAGGAESRCERGWTRGEKIKKAKKENK